MFGRVTALIEFHQPPKIRKRAEVTPRLGGDDLLYHLPGAVFLEQAIDQAKAEQLLGFVSGLFVGFHSESVREWSQAATALAVSSASRR